MLLTQRNDDRPYAVARIALNLPGGERQLGSAQQPIWPRCRRAVYAEEYRGRAMIRSSEQVHGVRDGVQRPATVHLVFQSPSRRPFFEAETTNLRGNRDAVRDCTPVEPRLSTRPRRCEQSGNNSARTPEKTGEEGRPGSKTSQQVNVSGPICKTSISGSNPDGASIFRRIRHACELAPHTGRLILYLRSFGSAQFSEEVHARTEEG